MKSIILINIFCLLAMSCTKQETDGQGYPMMYELNFEFFTAEMKAYKGSEIEMSTAMHKEGNELQPFGNLAFYPMSERTINSKTLIGPLIVDVGWEAGDEPRYSGKPLQDEFFHLFRFNNTEIDTLQVKRYYRVGNDNIVYPDKYEISYNNKIIKTFEAAKYGDPYPWVLTVQK